MTAAHSQRMPEPEHAHTEPMPHHEVPYVLVFFALVGLTIVTVAVALHRFEPELVNVLIALVIASIKGSLVALYFMHLKYEGKLIYLIFIVPLCLCVLLVMALIPDVVLNHADSKSASLHQINPVHLIPSKAAEGGAAH
jgi:cytochrome c oxidase subunit 4